MEHSNQTNAFNQDNTQSNQPKHLQQDLVITSRTYENLVVACHKHCSHGNHPMQRWLSVDRYIGPSKEADIKKSVENLTQADFEPYTKHRFKIIFIESISGGDERKRFEILHQFLADEGAIIIQGAGCETALENSLALSSSSKFNHTIESFIIYGDKAILVKKSRELKNIMEVYNKDINVSLPSSSYINKIYNQINVISNKYADLNSILTASLAHIATYINERKQRFVFGRNFFKDKLYDEMYQNMTDQFLRLNSGEITCDAIRTSIDEWGKKLPSSKTPGYKLGYERLDSIFLTCLEALNYYEGYRFNLIQKKVLARWPLVFKQ